MSHVLDALFAFLGAGVGSGVAYWGTRNRTQVERTARQREEWGRRFTSALEAINSTDHSSRATGRALLEELLTSPLATDDDRRAAQAVLAAAALHDQANLRLLLPPGSNLDDVSLVRDTHGRNESEGEPG